MVLWIGLVVGARARALPRGHREQQQPTATATWCWQIGCHARTRELLRQGHGCLDKNGDGVACESPR
jgi:hypothetical protein